MSMIVISVPCLYWGGGHVLLAWIISFHTLVSLSICSIEESELRVWRHFRCLQMIDQWGDRYDP